MSRKIGLGTRFGEENSGLDLKEQVKNQAGENGTENIGSKTSFKDRISGDEGSVLNTSLGRNSDGGSKGEAVLGAVAGSVMSGTLGSMANSSKNTFGNIMNAQDGSGIVEQIKPQTFYRGKNIRLRINDEVMDIKDVEMHITKEFSRHDELFMKFTIKTKELSKYYSYVFSFDNTLGVELAKSDMDFKRIFHTFNIEKMDIEESAGERSVVLIRTSSATFQMDKIKEFRSFQDMKITYETIIETFKEKYPKMKWFIGQELSQNLVKPYIQYNETDWEFLVRIAGDLNIPLFSHLDSVIMGNEINLMEEDAELRNAIYGKCRDGVNILFKVRNATQGVNAGQRMKIMLPDQGLEGEMGEDVRIVSKAYIRTEGDQVLTDYELIQESHKFEPILHTEFEGKSIEATVMEVVSENGIAKMKIDLSVGLMKAADNGKSQGYRDEYKGGFNFPYMTGFSQSNSGFFCTPESGDIVSLFFNSRNEGHAYVLQGAVNSPGNDRFNNPNVRNYTLGGDDSAGGKPMFDFQLSSKVFNVNVTDSINLNAKNKISNTSENGIEIAGKNNVNIISSEEMTIVSNNLREMIGSNKVLQANNSSEVISGSKNIISSDCNMGTSGVMNISGGGDVIINKG